MANVNNGGLRQRRDEDRKAYRILQQKSVRKCAGSHSGNDSTQCNCNIHHIVRVSRRAWEWAVTLMILMQEIKKQAILLSGYLIHLATLDSSDFSFLSLNQS
ncbi:hypothetical protein Eta_004 [Serratia phage Eta]|uniref:Uncharacterized protein n=1 Tax=Serratia phage Eta TaxID=1282995 RepID=R9VYH3_9CAUD|nr:hypothetical protein Eta_004 [Serratia phage Eta]AGN89450.1 hypothetical protein Eta_004 [Serratia phage Eta]